MIPKHKGLEQCPRDWDTIYLNAKQHFTEANRKVNTVIDLKYNTNKMNNKMINLTSQPSAYSTLSLSSISYKV